MIEQPKDAAGLLNAFAVAWHPLLLAEAQAMDHIVQPTLQEAHQLVARVAFGAFGSLKVAAKLTLQDTVVMLHLLLLTQVQTIVGHLAAAVLLLSGRRFASLDATLGRIAARAFEKQLHSVASAEATNGAGVSCHLFVSFAVCLLLPGEVTNA